MTDPGANQLFDNRRGSARAWLVDPRNVDQSVYAAIAHTPPPTFEAGRRAAGHSRLRMTSAAALALVGGHSGRRAAVPGRTSVAVTSAVVNLAVKRVGRRQRPDRAGRNVPVAMQVRMPTSASFPPDHSAAALAFATGVGNRLPVVPHALHAVAGVNAYWGPHRRPPPRRRALGSVRGRPGPLAGPLLRQSVTGATIAWAGELRQAQRLVAPPPSPSARLSSSRPRHRVTGAG